MERAITVEQLRDLCLRACANGYSKRKIMISQDDEGNGYHALYFEFAMPKKVVSKYTKLPFGVTKEEAVKDWIILG